MIITTHYIDETRQAHLIGLMRGGRFLAEESPNDLLRQYHAESLEEVFLKLSVLQNMGKRRRSSIATEVIEQFRASGAVAVSFNNILNRMKFLFKHNFIRTPQLTYHLRKITVKFLVNLVKLQSPLHTWIPFQIWMADTMRHLCLQRRNHQWNLQIILKSSREVICTRYYGKISYGWQGTLGEYWLHMSNNNV